MLPGLKFRWPKLNLLFAEEKSSLLFLLRRLLTMVVSLIIIVYIVISGELTGSGSQSVTWLECFNIITQHKYLWHQVWVEGKQGEHQNNLSQKYSGFSKCRLSTYVLHTFKIYFFNIVIFCDFCVPFLRQIDSTAFNWRFHENIFVLFLNSYRFNSRHKTER